MNDEIIRKLTRQFDVGITTEAQVVYVLAGVRKLIERDNERDRYSTLNFHCDWALHAHLKGTAAQWILKRFDEAHPHLRANLDIGDLPGGLANDIANISTMRGFKREFDQFAKKYGLPSFKHVSPDAWTGFLALYANVISDIPLIVNAGWWQGQSTDAPQHIARLTVRFERAVKPTESGEWLFKVNWLIEDKQGQTGEVFVIHGYGTLPTGYDVHGGPVAD
jgi:hypothetical protein